MQEKVNFSVDVPELKIVPGPPKITLNEGELMFLWEIGVLNDKAYIYFVIRQLLSAEWSDRLENGKMPSTLDLSQEDILYIRQMWSGESKMLTDKIVINAIVGLTNLKNCKCLSVVKQLSLLEPGELFI